MSDTFSDPGLIDGMKEHPSSFIGAYVANLLVQAFQTGVLVDLSMKFWSYAHHESRTMRLTVAFVSAVALYQTGVALYSGWRIFVLGYGNWQSLLTLEWPDRLQSLVTTALASPIQAFLIWRCWILTNKSWITLGGLSSLLVAAVASSIYLVYGVFTISVTPDGSGIRGQNSIFSLWEITLILSAVLDISVTTILLVFLLRSRSNVFSRRFRRVLFRLIMISWEAAVLPSACAMAAALSIATMNGGFTNFWYLFFQAILGKLYVMSLLITLNTRANLRKGDADGGFPGDSWTPPRIEIHVPTMNEEDSTSTQPDILFAESPVIDNTTTAEKSEKQDSRR
ncbi:hypothetical protein JAAARDRAFT_34945 [Jaapia argillacea MUCL 33604]|uniref:DUF6534 domain-containing protein n=1 Tax=Jaapia argillacea MUCL 33604 TaxID=933084 RepID=A0A067Q689_9AGAM|nr:hypothetical protein JAAARDRAFT_34945 [Jaapia argillacea MUCL 33604]